MATSSQSFSLLHPAIQRWIWEQGWNELRDAQEKAIPILLARQQDLIIAAATASGKTEAAFLPILSHLASQAEPNGSVLYLSPLKALINDQYLRLEPLCERLDLPVVPWHGDVGEKRKHRFLRDPRGILLITPESLESLFVRHGNTIGAIFGGMRYVVIDELHSFIGTERGRQVQSLLHRMERAISAKLPRIGLSATLSEMQFAASFLRPRGGAEVHVIESRTGSQELKLLVRGYVKRESEAVEVENEAPEQANDGVSPVGDDLYRTLQGGHHLAFANSRQNVEYYADYLRQKAERDRRPNEFWPHHGNLSKELREQTEAALKDRARPTTAVCTSTLEMGIDIGSVQSVAQVGCPHSVASLRQRLGRSGRRGEPAILRVFIEEPEITPQTAPQDCLRIELIQATAMLELLLARWCEPPVQEGLHLSTLVHQILSIVAQLGGGSPSVIWQTLCQTGPFATVDVGMFTRVLRAMAKHDLLVQMKDGTLLHGKAGERLVNHYSFYTVFQTQEEFRLVAGSQTLGSLPLDRPISVGGALVFAGRRWRAISVDMEKRIIEVQPAPGGKPPAFDGQAGTLDGKIRRKMRELLEGTSLPLYLDRMAQTLLTEARQHYRRLGLNQCSILDRGTDVLLFPWCGDRATDTLVLILLAEGVDAESEGVTIRVADSSLETVRDLLQQISASENWDPLLLSQMVATKQIEKFDPFLTEELLDEQFAVQSLDLPGARLACDQLLGIRQQHAGRICGNGKDE